MLWPSSSRSYGGGIRAKLAFPSDVAGVDGQHHAHNHRYQHDYVLIHTCPVEWFGAIRPHSPREPLGRS